MLGMVAEQDGDGEGAVEAREDGGDRFLRGSVPCSSWWSIRWATTSLSVSLWKTRPCACISSRSGRKFSMMPLWTRATPPTTCGWALPTVGAPWVAQRVWAMPTVPGSGSAASSRGEIVELALGPAAFEPAVDDRADAALIIAAIFEPPQPLHEPLGDFVAADYADDSAHATLTLSP